MVIFRDTRRFELTITEYDGYWLAKLQAFVPGRLYPISYLMREVSTREAAMTALIRVWQRLFPAEEPLQWRDPGVQVTPRLDRRSRHPEGREP